MITKEQFKEAREATGWTQEKAAKKLDVSLGTIRGYEQGLTEPRSLFYKELKRNKKRVK